MDLSQTLLFCILKSGIKATHFYWDYGILGYSTSYQPKVHLSGHCSNQFDEYLHGDGKCNHSWKGMYISVFKALDSYLIIQHDEPFKDDEITSVKYLVEVANQRYQNELSNF